MSGEKDIAIFYLLGLNCISFIRHQKKHIAKHHQYNSARRCFIHLLMIRLIVFVYATLKHIKQIVKDLD